MIFATGAVAAGPFGLNKGDSLSALKPLGLEPAKSAGFYYAKSVPSPHPQFSFYGLGITPEEGLCKIIAISKPIETSVYGSELKDRFESMRDALIAKYGEGKTYDYLRHGSIWDESKDWMMALIKKERVLETYWTGGTYPDGVTGINLEVSADERDSGQITLSYEFDNFAACRARTKAKDNESL